MRDSKGNDDRKEIAEILRSAKDFYVANRNEQENKSELIELDLKMSDLFSKKQRESEYVVRKEGNRR